MKARFLCVFFLLLAGMATGQARIDQFDSVGSATTPYTQIGSDSYFWLVNEQAPAAPKSRRMSVHALNEVFNNLGFGGGIKTASNGLTLAGDDVRLGGTLTGNVAITGNQNFNFIGLNSLNASGITTGVNLLAQTGASMNFQVNGAHGFNVASGVITDFGLTPDGLTYEADYNLTNPLSLTHKAHIDSRLNGFLTGILAGNASISGASSHSVNFSNLTGFIAQATNATPGIQLVSPVASYISSGTSWVLQDNRTTPGGIRYAQEYTLTDPRALTHKSYVDSQIPTGTNGLTSFNNEIFLGGEITSTTGLTLINGNWTIGSASGDINYQISPTTGISYNVFQPNFQDGVLLNLNPFGSGSMQLGYTTDGGGTVSTGFTISNGTINVSGLPTSASGLNPGDLWNNGGVLTIVP